MNRVSFRYSLDGADGTQTNALRKILEDAGFTNVGTAAYEHAGISPADLARTLQAFWNSAANLPGGVHVDHVWCYARQLT